MWNSSQVGRERSQVGASCGDNFSSSARLRSATALSTVRCIFSVGRAGNESLTAAILDLLPHGVAVVAFTAEQPLRTTIDFLHQSWESR
jgi:hypothetical protein